MSETGFSFCGYFGRRSRRLSSNSFMSIKCLFCGPKSLIGIDMGFSSWHGYNFGLLILFPPFFYVSFIFFSLFWYLRMVKVIVFICFVFFGFFLDNEGNGNLVTAFKSLRKTKRVSAWWAWGGPLMIYFFYFVSIF